ncbi:MAG: DUF308 domain-containing protein [Microbacteriaceae bacterium]
MPTSKRAFESQRASDQSNASLHDEAPKAAAPSSANSARGDDIAHPHPPLSDWIFLGARGLVAVVIALVVTFSADHSAELGYRLFAIFALLSGIVGIVMALRSVASAGRRSWFIGQGAICVAAGVVAVASSSAGVPFLLFLISSWAALTGAIELVTGLRARARIAQAKDWIFAGALTGAFAIAVLLIPAGYNEAYIGPDKVERFLTSSVVLVGALGAYAAILGVFLMIAAFSLRWPVKPVAAHAVVESEKLP